METAKPALALDNLSTVDQAQMTVIFGGQPLDWKWTFAGPGHEKTIAQNNRIARETIARDRVKEQAQTNGKKWIPPEVTPDERRADNVRYVLERLLGWTPVTMSGEDYPFSEENARKVLADPNKAWLYQQALEFLHGDNSFIARSATSS